MTELKIAMIAAVGANGVIGSDGDIPWRLPSDFAFFKQKTLGKPLIMGRKTFESIGRPLPGRTNIIITRQKNYQPDGVLVMDALDAALDHARTIAKADAVAEIMIGGGGEIYRQAMNVADVLYITHVDANPDGDARFPAIDEDIWREVGISDHLRSEKDSTSYKTRIYMRVKADTH